MTKLADLCELLAISKGAQFATITALTVPSMNKTDNPWIGRVEKEAEVNGVINWDYERCVNRQRIREGIDPDFEALERSWGQRIRELPFTVNAKTKLLYLELKVERSIGYTYFVLDAKKKRRPATEAEHDSINSWIRQPGPGRQGVDNPVLLRDYRFDHILSIRVGGTLHKITAATKKELNKLTEALLKTSSVSV